MEAADAAASVASPDALAALATNRIVFASYTADGGSAIWTMDPQGGTLARLTSFAGRESDPSWSYDRTHIAFSRFRNGYSDIYLMDADGTHEHWARSATYAGSIARPSWSPDGAKIAFASNRSGKLQIWTMNSSTGGSLTRITNVTYNAGYPAWAC